MLRRLRPVQRFTTPVTVAGLPLLGWLALSYPMHPHGWAMVMVLAAGVVVGELLPMRIPRRGEDEEVTVSTTFSFALLIAAGPGPAALALAVASVLSDVVSRKPAWRIAFNVGQYTLSLGAAALVLAVLTDVPREAGQPFISADLPAIVLAGSVMFALNVLMVGTAVALHQGVSVRTYMRRDFWFSASTSLILHALAPVVVATMVFSPELVPLFVFPVLAVYSVGRQGAADARHQALHDELTTLPSRAHVLILIEEALAELHRGEPGFAVMLLDLDRFKEVNDTLGHDVGDRMLQDVASRLRSALTGTDVVGRLGGDEFVVLARGVVDDAAARRVGHRIRKALAAAVEIEGLSLDADASIGIALCPSHDASARELLRLADVAMYDAKRHNLGIAVYDPRRDHHSAARLELVPQLRQGIDADELRVHFQPQVDITTGALVGVEALVRWQHPQRGLLMPGTFLPLAEATGTIRPLTTWMLNAVLEQVSDWRGTGVEVTAALNVSIRSLFDAQLPREVALALARVDVPASSLMIEITESSVMSDPATAIGVLARLADMGVRVSIDDFGTGHSSLAYLHELPASELKIDRSFIARLGGNSGGDRLVGAMIDLGHDFGLQVVGEGVETPAMLEALRGFGCDRAQGYMLGLPVPAAELAALRAADPRLLMAAPC